VAQVYIFQAALKLNSVQTNVYNVTRGETNLVVSMSVSNTGGTDANIDSAPASTYLTFNGGTANFTSTALTTNAAVVPAGGSVVLQYNVTVQNTAPLNTTVILSGVVKGTDVASGAVLNDNGSTAVTGSWIVAGAGDALVVFRSNGTPVAGAFSR